MLCDNAGFRNGTTYAPFDTGAQSSIQCAPLASYQVGKGLELLLLTIAEEGTLCSAKASGERGA